jgi:hypothetical protein
MSDEKEYSVLNYKVILSSHIQDVTTTFLFKHLKFTHPKWSNYEIIRQLIGIGTYDCLFLSKHAVTKVTKQQTLDIRDFKNICFMPDFVYAIHVNNMTNCKGLKLYHKSHGKDPIFEKTIDGNVTRVHIPLATQEEPVSMFVTSNSLMSVVPICALTDFVVELEQQDETIVPTADIVLSVGYIDRHMRAKSYIFERINEPMVHFIKFRDATYYVNGKMVQSQAPHVNKQPEPRTICQRLFGK